LGLFGPKGAEIGTYRTTFVYQGPFKEDSSTGSRVINEVVLGTRVNKCKSKGWALGKPTSNSGREQELLRR